MEGKAENLLFRARPNERNECDQWTLVRDADDQQDYVEQERVALDKLVSGRPYVRLVRRMTAGEFLSTDQPPAVKLSLRALLEERKSAGERTKESD